MIRNMRDWLAMKTCKILGWIASGCHTLVVLCGAILSAQGQTFELLHSFHGPRDGGSPQARLVEGSDGNFYGSTLWGSAANRGTLYRITPDGTFKVLYELDDTTGWIGAELVEGADGNFYGTSFSGGPSGDGTVFRMTPQGDLTTLYSFDYINGSGPNDLVVGSDGNFYGTTAYGGAYGDPPPWGENYGTVFRITPEGSLTTLLSFNGTNGAHSRAGLTLARDGHFYGVSLGGPFRRGTIFRMTPEGVLTTIAAFDGTNGFSPRRLVEAGDGTFYGTSGGGEHNYGTIFRVTADGSLTTVTSFNGTNGRYPPSGAALVRAWDGNYYGTTTRGGDTLFGGTVFRLTPDHVLTTVASFGGSFYEPRSPYSGLTLGRDGHLYGTTSSGGDYGGGTIFRILMPGPRLKFKRSGNDVLISWPANAAGFTLQSTVDLSSPEWMDSHDVPVVVNGHYTVTKEVSGGIRFYRLKR
jgi:uncharacterized repeat protein (TIGR03803 family)